MHKISYNKDKTVIGYGGSDKFCGIMGMGKLFTEELKK